MNAVARTDPKRGKVTKPSKRSRVASQLERLIQDRGTSPRALSEAAGKGSTYVRDILEGLSLNPRIEDLADIANALNCSLSELLGEGASSKASKASLPSEGLVAVPEKVARFRAARWAYFRDPAELAPYLDLTAEELVDIENGKAALTSELIRAFNFLTGCPLQWIESGQMTALPPEVAAQIGVFDPALVPHKPETGKR